MNVFRMVGSIALEGGKEANQELENFDSHGKKASFSLKKVATAVAGATVAVAGLATSVGALTSKMMKLTDEIDKQSQRIGISREAYQEWDFIMSQNGGNISTLVRGVQRMSRAVDEAKQGVETYSEYFERLNISLKDNNGEMKSQETLLNEVIFALTDMDDEVERAAISQQLLGRASMDLVPLFNQERDAIEEMKNQTHEYGMVLNDEVIDAGVKMTDTMDRIRRSFRAAMVNAIAPFVPQLEELATKFSDRLLPAMTSVIDWSAKIAMSIPIIWQSAVNVTGMIIDELKETFEKPMETTLQILEDLFMWFDEIGAIEGFNTVWNFSLYLLREGWDFIKDEVVPIINKKLETAWSWIIDVSKVAIPKVKDVVQTTWRWVVELTGGDWKAIKKAVEEEDYSALFDTSKDLAKGIITITAGLALVEGAGVALLKSIQGAMKTIGLAIPALGTLGIGGVTKAMALVSVGISLIEAKNEDGIDWKQVATKMGSAIVAGLVTYGITYNPTASVYVATIALNIDWGSLLNAVPFIGRMFSNEEIGKMLEDTGEEYVEHIMTGTQKVDDRVFAENILDKMGFRVNKAEALAEGTELGKALAQGLNMTNDEFVEFARNNAKTVIDYFRETLGIHSPSVEFWEIAKQMLAGMMKGIEDNFPGLAKEIQTMIDELEKVWGGIAEQAEDASDGVEEALTESGRGSRILNYFKGLYNGIYNTGKTIFNSIGEIVDDFLERPLASIEDAFVKLVENVHGLFKSLIGGIVGGLLGEIESASAGLGAGLGGFREGFESNRKIDEETGEPKKGITGAMIGGGVAGMAMGLAGESEEFQKLMEKLEPVITKVVELFGRLITPLLPLVDILDTMLQPLLKALQPLIDVVGELLFNMIGMLMKFIPPLISILTPILKAVTWTLENVIMPVMKVLYKAIAVIYNTIASAVNWLVSAINKIPFVSISWRLPKMDTDLPEYEQPPTETEEIEEDEGDSASGGTQISEITGPTRDLFVNLLSPLARLDSLTSIGNRIYNLLDERLGTARSGVTISEINIYGDRDLNTEELADELEEILSSRIDFATEGTA